MPATHPASQAAKQGRRLQGHSFKGTRDSSPASLPELGIPLTCRHASHPWPRATVQTYHLHRLLPPTAIAPPPPTTHSSSRTGFLSTLVLSSMCLWIHSATKLVFLVSQLSGQRCMVAKSTTGMLW